MVFIMSIIGIIDIIARLDKVATSSFNIIMIVSVKEAKNRLLLSTCAAEGLKLVTVDRALVDHALAWKPFPR
jgi:hypothetical protein